MGKGSSKQRDVIEYETTTDEGFTKTLRKDLQVLIAYASGAEVGELRARATIASAGDARLLVTQSWSSL